MAKLFFLILLILNGFMALMCLWINQPYPALVHVLIAEMMGRKYKDETNAPPV